MLSTGDNLSAPNISSRNNLNLNMTKHKGGALRFLEKPGGLNIRPLSLAKSCSSWNTRVRKLVIKESSGVRSPQVMGMRKAAMETVIWTRIVPSN